MNKIAEYLIALADELDHRGKKALANEIDNIITKCADNYPNWGATEGRAKQLELFNKFKNNQITKEQYQLELKKLNEQSNIQTDQHLEQKTYQKLQQDKGK